MGEEPSKSPTWTSLGDGIRFDDLDGVLSYLENLSPIDLSRDLSRLDKGEKTRLMDMLGPERAAETLSKIVGWGAANIVERLPPEQAGTIVEELNSRQQVDLLRKITVKDVEQIMRGIAPNKAEEIRNLMRYPENTAGGLMIPEFLSFSSKMKIQDVLDDLRTYGEVYSDYDVQYAYVVSDEGVLLGVLRLRDLLMATGNKAISEIMIKDAKKVSVEASLQDLREFFRENSFLGVPVVDAKGRLVGIVHGAAVREAANRRSNQLFMKFAGIVGGEESRNMSLKKRSSRRLSWLSVNIVLNIIAASVIALYQDTLEKAIVLAVFLPIISDMSGCSGNQAVAVSIRELTLGMVRPRELLRVFYKEITVGVVNGIVLGVLLGGAALLWKGNPFLGLVVGTSLALNTLVAVSIGGIIPLILRGMRMDPALASGPLLTTITDMCGFFFVLSFASFLLPRLIG